VDDESAPTVVALMDQLADVAQPICIAGPPTGPVQDLANGYDVPLVDDPRQLVVDYPARGLLLAHREGLRQELVHEAMQRGTHLLGLEPATGTLAESAGASRPAKRGSESNRSPGRRVLLPALRGTRGWEQSVGAMDSVGTPRLLHIVTSGHHRDCSTFARLYDGWRTALQFVDLPESIDASLVGPLSSPPREPRGLIGSLAVHARLVGGGVLAMLISGAAPAQRRELTIVGDQGQLWVSDDAYRLHDAAGQLLDSSETGVTSNPQQDSDYVNLVEAQLRRIIARNLEIDEEQIISDDLERQILACCEACLLSARTRHGEDPHSLMKILKAV